MPTINDLALHGTVTGSHQHSPSSSRHATSSLSYPCEVDRAFQIGGTRCYGAAAHSHAVDLMCLFDGAVRIVGGIPLRRVKEAAIQHLSAAFFQLPGERTFLIGCTLTRSSNGSEIASVPGQGIVLQGLMEKAGYVCGN
jgi:hypothetical protein